MSKKPQTEAAPAPQPSPAVAPPPPASTLVQQVAPLAPGETVDALDWSKDPDAPTVVDALVLAVNDDGTINAKVKPPGIEPYLQEGLRASTAGELVPGQFRRRGAAPVADMVVHPTPSPAPTPDPTPEPNPPGV